ncbi:hypothetical protein R0K04_22730, partial [Pseudoalteromonas sp. SIMBA_153]
MNMVYTNNANNKSIDVKPPSLGTGFRSRDVIMDAQRLGAMHQTRISFVRTLLRKIDKEKWTLS